MDKLEIKTVSLPERCEVCHKDDCFDAVGNYCTRCAGVTEIEFTSPGWKILQRPRQPLSLFASFWFGTAGLIPGILIFFLVSWVTSRMPDLSNIFRFFLLLVFLPALVA